MPDFSEILTAKGLTVFSGFLIASVANAFQDVKKNGWKGVWFFTGNVVVAVSAGQIVYSFLDVVQPNLALPAGFAAAYIGPNSVKMVWEGFTKTISNSK